MKKHLFLTFISGIFFSPFIQAETNITVLSPLTVTATRTEQADPFVSSTIITREDIERRQLRSVEEALRGIAGINIGNTGGLGKQTSIFLRGTESNHVLVLIDGVRAGSPEFGITTFEHLPISEIETIEVVRGPRSSLYGSDAIGGIIHIRTRRGTGTTIKPSLSVGTGSHDRHRYSAGISGEVQNTWYNVNVSHEQSNGFNACSSGFNFGCFTVELDDDDYRNEAASVRLGHRFFDRLVVEGHALYSEGDTHTDGFFNQSDFVQHLVGGQIRLRATDFWKITLKAGENGVRRKDNGFEQSYTNTKRFTFSAQNDFSITENHILSLGYDYQDDTLNSSDEYTVHARHNNAFFAQYQGYIDNLQIILGIREDNDEQFGHNNTWNSSLGYQFDNGLLLSASYGTAYKTPTFVDLYLPNTQFGSGDPSLKPEQSTSYEVGIGGQHDWGHWSINGYITYIDNLISVVNTGPGPTGFGFFVPENTDKARIRGIELIAGTQVYGFDINSNLTLLNPENMSSGANAGNLLPRRAEQVFRFDIDRRFGRFGLGSTVIAEGRRFDNPDNTRRVSGFVTLDLRAEYEIIDSLILQAKVNNVLDKHYQTVAGYDQDNLNIFFTLRYNPDI